MGLSRRPAGPETGTGDESSGQPVPARSDWRETFTLAADLALIGVAMVAAIVLVFPAGATVATASAALDHWLDRRSWPTLRELAGTLGRALLPGVGATLVALAITVLLILDLNGLASGRVPGGTPALVLMSVVTALLVALAGLTIVEVGRRGGQGWYRATLAAGRSAYRRPLLVLAVLGALLPAVVIAWMIKVTILILPGYALFALHVVRRRLDR